MIKCSISLIQFSTKHGRALEESGVEWVGEVFLIGYGRKGKRGYRGSTMKRC